MGAADELARKGKGHRSAQQLLCSITSDKQRVYVGDTVVVSVSLKNSGEVSRRSLENIVVSSGATVTQLDQQPLQEVEDDGHIYEEVVQNYAVSVDEPGVVVISPVRATFTIPDNNDPFSQMNGVFGRMPFGRMFDSGKSKTIRSNQLKIEFVSLPETDKVVDAIGDFSHFSLAVDKREIAVNEPVMVSVSLRGHGNFDAILPPNLRLPSSATVYPSQTRSQGMTQRVFEYIVQVSEPGTVVLPEQEFYYFDTVREQYQVLKTTPITLTVTGSVSSVSVSDSSEAQPSTSESVEEAALARDIPYITSSGMMNFPADAAIPLWLYLLLVTVILLIGFYPSIARLLIILLWRSPKYFEYSVLRPRLQQVINKKHVDELYDIFRDVCVVRFSLKKERITSEYIAHTLMKEGWDSVHAQKSAHYIDLCAKASFAAASLLPEEQAELLDNAQYWFDLITTTRGDS